MTAALAALLTFVATSVLTALLLVLPTHAGLHRHTAVISLLVGVLTATAAFLHTRRLPANRPFGPRRPVSVWAWLIFAVFAAFALREFAFLIYTDSEKIAIGSPNNLGDISLHMHLARYFANGARWWPDHPEISGQPLRYYPGVDLFQSLLLLVGADDLHALAWVGLLGSAATAAALYRWGGSFTVAAFLFSGGVAGFQFFNEFKVIDYQAELAWKNLPLAVFVTQRPFLYALPAGLLLLAHWREKFFGAPPAPRVETVADIGQPAPVVALPPANAAAVISRGLLPFWVEALLYATLPVFHLFAFVFVSLLLGWWFAVYFIRPAVRWHLLKLVGVALIPATLQVALMTANFSSAGGKSVWLEPGWMAHGKAPSAWLGFWLLNFGLWAILAIALWLQCALQVPWTLRAVPRPGYLEREAKLAFVLPAGLIFVLSCVVMFAVWDWDNTKLMLWAYLAALPFIYQVCVRPLLFSLRVPLCLLLFFSGAISLAGGMSSSQMNFLLIKRNELNGVRRAMHALPIDGRFASSPDYNHPLVYCGRKLAMGYDGHLYSQGIDYSAVSNELNGLMLGAPDWREDAKKLGVRYMFWGTREQKKYPRSRQPWAAHVRPVAKGLWGSIYDLQAPAGK